MCYDAKSSLLGWVVGTGLGLALWYRNWAYDRIFAAFIIIFSLIQLLEYGAHSMARGSQTSRLIYLVLWLQPFILAVMVYTYLPNTITFWWLVLMSIALGVAIITLLFSSDNWTIYQGVEGHLVWERTIDGVSPGEVGQTRSGFMNLWTLPGSWLYLLGLFVPILLLMWYSQGWLRMGMIILFLYGLITLFYTMTRYSTGEMGSMWCYYAVGFAMLVWLIPLFCQG